MVSQAIVLLKHEDIEDIVQILNERLAKDVAAIVCSGNLSSQQINKNQLGTSRR